jgi:hypothetical protein
VEELLETTKDEKQAGGDNYLWHKIDHKHPVWKCIRGEAIENLLHKL